jgi:uncharacterized protein (DUF1697 family)
MAKYVALLRGIGPGNPNMHNDKLRGVLESLGLQHVQSVISSGNVLFESSITSAPKLEAMIQEAWPAKLGFNSTTIVRSYKDLQELIHKKPFGNRAHSPRTSLNVTFIKAKPAMAGKVFAGENYEVLTIYDREVCSIVDTTAAKTPQLMAQLEKRFGKDITTRTWKTVLRIASKMA